MNLDGRLRRLEEQPVSESYLYDRADAVARAHHLNLDEVIEEARRFLAMSPAQQAAADAEQRAGAADLDRERFAAECAQHGGRACLEAWDEA